MQQLCIFSTKENIWKIYIATWIVQYLFFLKPEFQCSSLLLCLYSLVCVRPGRKPQRPVFSRHGSNNVHSDQLSFRVCICAFFFFFFSMKLVFSLLDSYNAHNLAFPNIRTPFTGSWDKTDSHDCLLVFNTIFGSRFN